MESKKYICTYFDYNFLARGLALFYSVKRYHDSFKFYVLAFDEKTFEYLSSLKEENLVLISKSDYNNYFNTSDKNYSDRKQYFFSTTPNLCIYLMHKYPEINILLYLDADVYLYNSLESLYEEFGDSSVGVTPHRVNPFLKLLARHYGNFNIGVNLFRNSESGLMCLTDWKNDCDSWYSGKPGYPLKFFSDQIFLDTWPEKYKDLKIIENPGVNLVYWNAANYTLSFKDEKYYVDKSLLIIYHFSSLRKINDRTWNTYSVYGLLPMKGKIKDIYIDYIRHIESFGLDNRSCAELDHRESLRKRISHFVLSSFINEKVITDSN